MNMPYRGTPTRLVVNRSSGETEKKLQHTICPILDKCGVCKLLETNYKTQLIFKKNLFKEELKKANLEAWEPKVLDCESSQKRLNFRHVANVHAKESRPSYGKKKWIDIGYVDPYTNRVLDLRHCPVQLKVINDILDGARRLIKELDTPLLGKDRASFFLKQIVVKVASDEKSAYVNLYVNKLNKGLFKEFALRLTQEHDIIKGISLTADDSWESLKEFHVLVGKNHFEDSYEGMTFTFSPLYKAPVNPYMETKVLKALKDHLQIQTDETLVDLYTHAGVRALTLASYAKKVIGISQNAQDIKDAQTTAQENQIKNATFLEGEEEAVFRSLLEEKTLENLGACILQPTKKGLSASFIESLLLANPKQILYLSTHPTTCLEDLRRFKGYTPIFFKLFDVLPNTSHYEILCVLKKDA
jgi:23S rRNA (uracil1939-C5)-methyltransferase